MKKWFSLCPLFDSYFFSRYIRMSPEWFDHLLGLIENRITKEETNFRKAISAGEKLAVALRFLASEESKQLLSFAYLIGKSVISRIIWETCDVMFEALAVEYLHPPSLTEEWGNIARDFQETWNLPHVVDAIDDKHIRIQCLKLRGTVFHNYKRFFSFEFLAICDARYCFTLFDVDLYGSNNDAVVLAYYSIGQKIEAGEMNIPPLRHLDGCLFDPLPYYLVGDEIFPHKTWLMKLYPGQLSTKERILHYWLSRAR